MDDCILRRQRERDIMHCYFETLRSPHTREMGRREMLHFMAEAPAPRFYVSYEIARRIISRMERQLPINVSNRKKREMYEEIFRQYRNRKRNTERADFRCLNEIITSPAPSFYVSDITMQGIIYRSLRRKRK